MNLFKRAQYFINRVLEHVIYSANFIALTKNGNINKKVKLKGARIYGDVSIAEGCKIIDGVIIKTLSSITINRYSSINGPNTDLLSYINPITIGSFCSIARNVSMQEFNHNYKTITSYHINRNVFGHEKRTDIYSNGAIEIGNDVWIGTHCVILSGAKIGNGAIIAANSVVVGDIPAYAIAGGNPAKVLKYRFDEETIELLQKISWWNWSIEKIKRHEYLFKDDISKERLKKFLLENND